MNRTASRALRLVSPRTPMSDKAVVEAEDDAIALEWRGSVRLSKERATGTTAAVIQSRVRADLLERLVLLGAEHHAGAHADRPELAVRWLRHIDALAEAGVTSASIGAFAEQAELEERPGAHWALALVRGTLELPNAEEAFEDSLRAIDPESMIDFRFVAEVAAAIDVAPNRALAARRAAWLRDPSPIVRAIAIELSTLADLTDEHLERFCVAVEPITFVAFERLLARTQRDARGAFDKRPLPARGSWLELEQPEFAYEVARARSSLTDPEPLALIRNRDEAARAALGTRVLEVLALGAAPIDDELAGELAASLPTSEETIQALGLLGLPSSLRRLIGDLVSEDFSDEAAIALGTALGDPPGDPRRPATWAPLVEAASSGHGLRVRGGAAHDASAVLGEARRPDLSEFDLRFRADELYRITGRTARPEWGGFGVPLDAALATLAALTR
ncbi:MAG: hypothetical protein U0271_22430 [Polyangiaceae bacterium]